MLAKELEQAVKNKRVKSILFEVDSPGGEVGGVAEFANMIYQARQTKPIYSYATSLSASAGYWLQSATTKSYAGKTAFIGSVGVLHASYVNDNKKLIITSKYAPKKHLNAGDKDWKQGVKEKIDHLESFFHADLSRFRGVSIAHVQNEFGQGDVLNAEQALKARMIDEISTFEDVLGKLGISMEENDEIKGMLATLVEKIYKRWIKVVILYGQIKIPKDVDLSSITNAIYSAPVVQNIDPTKDIGWKVMAIDNKLMSRTEVIRSENRDPEQTMMQIVADREFDKKYELDQQILGNSGKPPADTEQDTSSQQGIRKAA